MAGPVPRVPWLRACERPWASAHLPILHPVSSSSDVPLGPAPRAALGQTGGSFQTFCEGALHQKQTWCLLCRDGYSTHFIFFSSLGES